MGAEFSREVEKQARLYQDRAWNDYVNSLGQKIVSVCDRRNLQYHFKVIDDSTTVNAFALPGGYVYVYTGLLLRADNEAEVIGVMAHEVGHVVCKHGVRRLSTIYGYQILIAIALGKNPDQLQQMAADILGGLGMLKYGRENEFEADRCGIKYLYALGYDPKAFIAFFEKLEGISQRSPSKVDKWLSTHPQTNDRIKQAEQQIAQYPPKQNAVLNTEYYVMMKKELYQK